MKITVTTLDDANIYNLDVSDDMELENFKALCEFESGVPSSAMTLLVDGRPLQDPKLKLKDYGVKEGDVVLMQRMQGTPNPGGQASNAPGGLPNMDFSQIQVPGGPGPSRPRERVYSSNDPAALRDMLLKSPHDLALLKERNPALADALLTGDLGKFTDVLRKQKNEQAEKERQRIRLLNADPFDIEVQSKIAEEIRLKNVDSNMEAAMEFSPESFGQVVMLYIDCRVNGHPVKAFVDSGAQMTIMSQACASRCGIERLVDRRWAGIAKGVGTQKIIGRVHLCQIQIEKDYLQTSFSILENQPMDMLLGLDMLKRHQCILDMKSNNLVIGTTGTVTRFLAEGDLPEHARLNRPGNAAASETELMDEDNQLAQALHRSQKDTGQGEPSTGGSLAANVPTSSPAPTPSFPEASITKITSQGFTREQAIQELAKTSGNAEQAIMALLAKAFQVP